MLNSNTFFKIISVLIAVVMWAYVIEVTEPVKDQIIPDVPVQLRNEESLAARGLALSGEAAYTVDVKIQAKKADLSKISASDIVAEADLFGYSMGKNYIPVTLTAPESVTIINASPIKINVVIEELVEVSRTIRVNFIGQFEDGVEAGQVTTQPTAIKVSGARSEVSAVAYVKADVTTSSLTEEDSTVQANAVAVNRNGDVVSNVRLSSSFVSVTARLSRVKEVPLSVEITGEVAPIYEVTDLEIPGSVKIKGSMNDLAGISGLTAAAIDISPVASTTKIPLNITLPEGVELADGYQNMTVGVTIKPVATTQFIYTSDEIQMEGVDGVSDIMITTPQITITVSGSEEVIAGLKKEDIQPYLVLDAESLISATAKVQVRYDKPLGHIAVDPEEVHITLDQTE
ncbi:MAG TPA: CdaR family protein [Anaerovoracaceae bacterium]|nr:CdaR family protein [Anaerovoracaceae bacterium]